jgi:hypothetical protein
LKKAALVRAQEIERSAEIPPGSSVVLDFGEAAYVPSQSLQWTDAGLAVAGVLAELPRLDDPRVASFVEQSTRTLLRLRQPPDIREAVALAGRLQRAHLSIELPLRNEDDLNVLKILSSLNVKTSIGLDSLAAGGDTLNDALADAMLRPGKRAPVSPFHELQEHYGEDRFELACLDYRENDYYVDLRGPRVEGRTPVWESPPLEEKRLPFLLERRPCAWCEGLLFCHGCLLGRAPARAAASEQVLPCRAFFGEFMELMNLARAKASMPPLPPAPLDHGGKW